MQKLGAKVAASCEFGECGDCLGRACDPRFKGVPAFGRYGNDGMVEHVGLNRGRDLPPYFRTFVFCVVILASFASVILSLAFSLLRSHDEACPMSVEQGKPFLTHLLDERFRQFTIDDACRIT